MRDEPVRTSAWEAIHESNEAELFDHAFLIHTDRCDTMAMNRVLKTKSSLAFHSNERFLLNQPPEQVLRFLGRFLGGGEEGRSSEETDQTSPEAKVPALEGEGRGC